MKLSAEQTRVLHALAQGGTLKVHRSMEGAKVHKLHPLDGDGVELIPVAMIRSLERRGLIKSNMKFPAATYLLTNNGADLAASLTQTTTTPLLARLTQTQ